MSDRLNPSSAALLREAVAGTLEPDSLVAAARQRGEVGPRVDALTIAAVHYGVHFQREQSEALAAEARELTKTLDTPRPIEIVWHLSNMASGTHRLRGDLTAAANANRAALDAARDADYEYGVRRSLMNLIEVQSERGLNGEAFRLLCEVRDIDGLDDVERGHVFQLVADQLLELRAPDLAFEQYERALELLPDHYQQARLISAATLVVTHCERDDLDRAELALGRLRDDLADVSSTDSQAVRTMAEGAVARLRGEHESAIEWCERLSDSDESSDTERLVQRWIIRTWSASLNEVGRHREVIDRWAELREPVDDRLCRQLAIAYEQTGDVESAFYVEQHANAIAAERQVSFPAAIEVVEQVDIGLAIRRGTSELATANERIRRIGSDIEFITTRLLGDVSEQLAGLIELFDSTTHVRVESEDFVLERGPLDRPLAELEASLASLRSRERPVANEGTVDAAALLEHACRACDRDAAERSIKLVRCAPDSSARTDWSLLPAWTAQIRQAISGQRAPVELRVAVDGTGSDMSNGPDIVLATH